MISSYNEINWHFIKKLFIKSLLDIPTCILARYTQKWVRVVTKRKSIQSCYIQARIQCARNKIGFKGRDNTIVLGEVENDNKFWSEKEVELAVFNDWVGYFSDALVGHLYTSFKHNTKESM